jgi:hypothetical protein
MPQWCLNGLLCSIMMERSSPFWSIPDLCREAAPTDTADPTARAVACTVSEG